LPELTKSSDENINVLYLSKNIVSGDFYWMYQKNELKFYAVIDCTGHGVPGAFLSMLAHTGLNYAIANSISNLPADILDEMNTFVKQALKQQNNHSIQDRMEVGVCVYNSKTNELNYAGASINLLYFQNKKLNIIKASKCTVGSFQPHVLSRPENHCLTMQKGDRIFMHSDGVIDQFGAKSNKKLTSKKFKEMLEYSIGFNFEKQFKFIDDEITIWKGDMEQTDDILFMCVEL
jgi:serine phosphatase RsbU (regulator of sigma subunit)